MSSFVNRANTGNNQWVFYLLSLFAIFMAYVLGQVPLILVLWSKVQDGTISSAEASEFFDTIDFQAIGMPSHIGLLLLLGSAFTALIALYMCITFIHKRPFISSITSRVEIDWTKVVYAFVFWFILTGLGEVVMYLRAPETYVWTFEWRAWIPLFIVAVVFVPLQTSFEEILTRGYLLQGFGLWTRSKWATIAITSTIFAAMHLGNPEIAAFGREIMLVYYVSVALFLAILTFLDEGLEYALGIHAATNVYGASIVSFEGSVLQTETMIRATEISPVWMLFLFYGMMILFYAVSRRIFGMQSPKTLFQKIQLEKPIEIAEEHELPV